MRQLRRERDIQSGGMSPLQLGTVLAEDLKLGRP